LPERHRPLGPGTPPTWPRVRPRGLAGTDGDNHGAAYTARVATPEAKRRPRTRAPQPLPGRWSTPSVGVLHVGLVQFEPETPVHRDGGGVVTLDIEDDLTQPPCDEITQSRDGQGLAHTSPLRTWVDAENVHLPDGVTAEPIRIRRVDLGPVESGEGAVRVFGEEETGRIEPVRTLLVAQVGRRERRLLRVPGERPRVEVHQSLVVIPGNERPQRQSRGQRRLAPTRRTRAVRRRATHHPEFAGPVEAEPFRERTRARMVAVRPSPQCVTSPVCA